MRNLLATALLVIGVYLCIYAKDESGYKSILLAGSAGVCFMTYTDLISRKKD